MPYCSFIYIDPWSWLHKFVYMQSTMGWARTVCNKPYGMNNVLKNTLRNDRMSIAFGSNPMAWICIAFTVECILLCEVITIIIMLLLFSITTFVSGSGTEWQLVSCHHSTLPVKKVCQWCETSCQFPATIMQAKCMAWQCKAMLDGSILSQ